MSVEQARRMARGIADTVKRRLAGRSVVVLRGAIHAVDEFEPVEMIHLLHHHPEYLEDTDTFIGELEQYIGPELMPLQQLVDRDTWLAGAVLSGLFRAVSWSLRLAGFEQSEIDAVSGLKQRDPEQDGFTARQAHGLRGRAVHDTSAQLFAGSGDCGVPSIPLCSCSDDGTVNVQWIDGSGRSSPAKPMERVAEEALVPVLKSYILRARMLAKLGAMQRDANRAALDALCPDILALAEQCLASGQAIGCYLGPSEDVMGKRVDIFIYADASGLAPRVDLIVRQEFEEFMLESPDGIWAFFHSGHIQARVRFTADVLFELRAPEVRIPPESLKFVHPYTGHLGDDPFARVKIVNAQQCPPDTARPIPDRVRAMSGIGPRSKWPQMRDMCIPRQWAVLHNLDETIREKGDVRAVISRMLILAWQGLTRAHQWVDLAPRIGWESLPYQVSIEVDPAEFGVRMFPFVPVPV